MWKAITCFKMLLNWGTREEKYGILLSSKMCLALGVSSYMCLGIKAILMICVLGTAWVKAGISGVFPLGKVTKIYVLTF